MKSATASLGKSSLTEELAVWSTAPKAKLLATTPHKLLRSDRVRALPNTTLHHHATIVHTMRLRLRIERNSLPATQSLWPVKDSKSTIAQLLQHINEVFPLEGETWGLEDYSVAVGGYECLHYHEIEAVCKEDDEVTIKPLQWVDVRSRSLTGRNQISSDGRHLVDGVPFGRPCLRNPVRPELRIPPRKRRRLSEDDEGGPLMLTENGEELDEDEDDEDEDEDFEAEDSEDAGPADPSISEKDSDSSDDPTSDSDSDSSSSDSSSDDTSESASHASSAVIQTTPAKPAVNHKQANGSMTAAEREQQAQKEDEDTTTTQAKNITVGIPYSGKVETKSRNARRREVKKLKFLKENNILSTATSLDELRQWQSDNPGVKFKAPLRAKATGTDQPDEVSRAAGEDATKAGANDAAEEEAMVVDDEGSKAAEPSLADSTTSQAGTRGKKRKRNNNVPKNVSVEEQQNLISAIASGGIDVTQPPESKKRTKQDRVGLGPQDDDEPPSELSSKVQLQPLSAPSDDQNTPNTKEASASTPASTPARRSKFDLSSVNRLVFGGLGLRVPKTQEDRERLQKKLAEKPKRKTEAPKEDTIPAAATEAGATDEAEEHYDAWKGKIDLTAVECCEEGITLSTPPFPFYQRWDPQQRRKKTAKRVSGAYMHNGRRGKQNAGYYTETYDKWNTDGNGGDALEYDDVGVDDEYWEEGALLGDDDEELEDAGEAFPPLPVDISILTALPESEARLGDFVAYSELACDQSTGWQPKMVTRLAKVTEKLDAENESVLWVLQMSTSDRTIKKYDEDGQRLYAKFEMPDDEEVEDDGRKEAAWNELGEVKLVLRQETVEANGKDA